MITEAPSLNPFGAQLLKQQALREADQAEAKAERLAEQADQKRKEAREATEQARELDKEAGKYQTRADNVRSSQQVAEGFSQAGESIVQAGENWLERRSDNDQQEEQAMAVTEEDNGLYSNNLSLNTLNSSTGTRFNTVV